MPLLAAALAVFCSAGVGRSLRLFVGQHRRAGGDLLRHLIPVRHLARQEVGRCPASFLGKAGNQNAPPLRTIPHLSHGLRHLLLLLMASAMLRKSLRKTAASAPRRYCLVAVGPHARGHATSKPPMTTVLLWALLMMGTRVPCLLSLAATERAHLLHYLHLLRYVLRWFLGPMKEHLTSVRTMLARQLTPLTLPRMGIVVPPPSQFTFARAMPLSPPTAHLQTPMPPMPVRGCLPSALAPLPTTTPTPRTPFSYPRRMIPCGHLRRRAAAPTL